MGWFEEQLRARRHSDEESAARALSELASAVTGGESGSARDEESSERSALERILRFYHIARPELADAASASQEALELELARSGIMSRSVQLKDSWFEDGMGAMLAKTKAGATVALIPRGTGYVFYDVDGARVRVTRKNASDFEREAVCFYKPLPLKSMSVKDFVLFMAQSLSAFDYIYIAAATLAVTLIGMLTPYANSVLYSKIIPYGEPSLLLPAAALLIGASVSALLLNITKASVMSRVNTKLGVSVRAAAMARVFSLPVGFFKQYGSGELASRVETISTLCSTLANITLVTALSSAFSLAYIAQIASYAPSLTAIALLVIAASLAFSVLTTLMQLKISRRRAKKNAKLSGLIFALLSGIQKIKLTGAESRAFSKWASAYGEVARLSYAPPVPLRIAPVISLLISSGGGIAIYYFAVRTGVSVAQYMAFFTAYGMVSGAVLSLSSVALTFAGIRPMLDMARPIFEQIPETAESKRMITSLSGAIDISNLSFRYSEGMPLVLDDLSLKIRAGQYVAVVGATGCGKSTLVRLLLGFEKPLKGAVYYDGASTESIDLKSLRRRIGSVMQDGRLFAGDIYSNIAIACPGLSLEGAWEAAESAGIADDIRDMPMGMHTLISEGSGGVSGGQRQRLLIARAVAGKPRILIFDEATSALDNITQKRVSDALGSLKCTRIVIAHRLSTIKQCDRIVVLDGGKIVEDGRYEELVTQKGLFAELVARQRLEEES